MAPNEEAFRKALNAYIAKRRIQVQDMKIDFLEVGSAAYSLTLRMRQDVTITDVSDFLETVGDVRAVSFEVGA